MSAIKLGYKVKDKITGFEGIVNHTVEYAFQGLMAGVSPIALDKDGEVRSAHIFDVTQLEILNDVPPFAIPAFEAPLFKMGEKVRDVLTGYEGTVAGFADYINGCRRFLVRPQFDKTKEGAKMKDGEFIPEGSLEKIAEAKAEIPKTKRGGPADFDSSLT